jgi:hypothetical protein
VDRCSSCGAEIEWGVTAKGRRVPLDSINREAPATPNLIVVGTFRNGTLAVDVAADGDERPRTRVAHFATCPNAKQHRRRG